MIQNKVIVGLQYGDEGKGVCAYRLSKDYDYACRFNGGDNAGHTLFYEGKKIVLHLIPSGILTPKVKCVIGRGVAFNCTGFLKEIDSLLSLGFKLKDLQTRIYIDDHAHVVQVNHLEEDKENITKIGSTGRGIGPCYRDKIARVGLRIRDLKNYQSKDKKANTHNRNLYKKLSPYLKYPKNLSTSKVICEGAQSILLDITSDEYPFVTSSHTLPQYVLTSLKGSPRNFINVGIMKGYTTKVSSKGFITEENNEMGNLLRSLGNEIGATTGRNRRCGWLDLVSINQSIELGHIDELILTKADILTQMPYVNVCYAYDKKGQPLYRKFKPWKKVSMKDREFKTFFNFLQKNLSKKITHVSYGPNRQDIFKV